MNAAPWWWCPVRGHGGQHFYTEHVWEHWWSLLPANACRCGLTTGQAFRMDYEEKVAAPRRRAKRRTT